MAIDIFLRLDTIRGESIDRMFRDQIQLQNISFGVHNPVVIDSSRLYEGGSVSDGKATADRLVVTKPVDSTSVLLAKALVTGVQLPTGRVSFRNPATGLVFLTVDLAHVWVTDIQSVTSGADDRPGEQVTLAFGDIGWTYIRKNPDGSTTQTNYYWSFITNSDQPSP